MLQFPQEVLGDIIDEAASRHKGSPSGTASTLWSVTLVFHEEQPEWQRPDPITRKGRLGYEGEDVERVAVVGMGLGDEAVNGRVSGGGEQHPIGKISPLSWPGSYLFRFPSGDPNNIVTSTTIILQIATLARLCLTWVAMPQPGSVPRCPPTQRNPRDKPLDGTP